MKITIESPFVQAGMKATNLLIVNFWLVVGCIPVVTAGASVTAAFTVLLKMSEDREDVGITRAFWAAWAANLKHGVLLTLALLACAWSAWMSWQLFEKLPDNPVGFLIVAFLVVLLAFTHFAYVFPLEARYKNSLLQQMRNSRLICIRFFGKTTMLAGVLGLQVLIFGFTAPVLTYAGIFFAPALAVYTTCQVAMPIFRTLEGNGMADDGITISSERDW
ncbi:MAG: YesL family protein [Coriobacteriia bacterium]|nr:YesL family protein [Coriobacteriia bacterium]